MPGLSLAERSVYTVFAMGLAGGEPALQAVPSLDATAAMVLPATGGLSPALLYALITMGLGLLTLGIGLIVHRQSLQSNN